MPLASLLRASVSTHTIKTMSADSALRMALIVLSQPLLHSLSFGDGPERVARAWWGMAGQILRFQTFTDAPSVYFIIKHSSTVQREHSVPKHE